MDVFVVLAVAALIATAVVLVRGIAAMMRDDDRASGRMMWRRVEFQGAAVGLVLVAVLLAIGWYRSAPPPGPSVDIALGVMSATDLRSSYAADSPEAKAYGGIPGDPDQYLVTVAVRDRSSGKRLDNADVTATVGPLGLSGTQKRLAPATFGGVLTYGNYFAMPKPGHYEVNVLVRRPGSSGRELVQLNYERP